MAVFEAESWDKIAEVFSHPDYKRVVFPDEQNMIDRARSQVFAGEFATILDKSVQSKVRPAHAGFLPSHALTSTIVGIADVKL